MVTIHSNTPNNIASFDVTGSFSDVDFHIPGLEKPLSLHRTHLAAASMMLKAVFLGQNVSCCRYIKEKNRAEWTNDKAGTNETYRGVLVKLLRLCYGEDQTFSADECAAALAVSLQLQLTHGEELKTAVEKFMLETAKKDVCTGAKMLRDCVSEYEECSRDDICKKLAKIVLTTENMKRNRVVVMEECLMNLPADYLDMIEFKEGDEEVTEFQTRMKYVKYNVNKLSEDQKRKVIFHCKLEKLKSRELKEVQEVGLISYEGYVGICLERLETEREGDKKRIDCLERERAEDKRTIDRLTQEMRSLKRERDDDKKRIDRLTEEKRSLENERYDDKRKIDKLAEEMRSLKKERDKDKKVLDKLDEDFRERTEPPY